MVGSALGSLEILLGEFLRIVYGYLNEKGCKTIDRMDTEF